MGATAVLLDQGNQTCNVLLQRRSNEGIVDAGKLSFVPVFGLEPNATPARRSDLGLLQYNLLREFGEELFDIPELVEDARSNTESVPTGYERFRLSPHLRIAGAQAKSNLSYLGLESIYSIPPFI